MTAVSSCTATPSVNQRGTWELVIDKSEDVAHFVPQSGGPVELAGRAARGAVHGDGVAESHAEGAETGHAQRADREILVVGIGFHLNRVIQLDLVLLLVNGDDPLYFGLEVGPQKFALFFVEPQDGAGRGEGDEFPGEAVQQGQRVFGGLAVKELSQQVCSWR